jgi:hypothetical protein
MGYESGVLKVKKEIPAKYITRAWQYEPFERPLGDVNSAASHSTMRYTMMESQGSLAFGLRPAEPGVLKPLA